MHIRISLSLHFNIVKKVILVKVVLWRRSLRQQTATAFMHENIQANTKADAAQRTAKLHALTTSLRHLELRHSHAAHIFSLLVLVSIAELVVHSPLLLIGQHWDCLVDSGYCILGFWCWILVWMHLNGTFLISTFQIALCCVLSHTQDLVVALVA